MKRKQLLPLILVFCLFFLWAISSNLLPTMIRQLMKTCELNAFEASFTETAYWLAYFICPIPIAMFMKRYSYKSGIVFGLLLAALGGLLFFPAAIIKEYWAYLCIFFVIAAGMCFLETAANPYVAALGDESSAPRRLNLAQSFNGLGAFVAAMFLSKLVLSGNTYTRETLPAGFEGGWEGYIQMETDAMKLPYLILAGVLIVIAILFIIVKLPKIKEEENTSNVYLVKDGTLFLLYGRNDFEKMTNQRYEYIKGLNGHFEITLYVDTFEEEELIDIDEVRANIASIEEELKVVQEQMDRYLRELGL